MPNKKSAIKALKQSLKKAAHNKKIKSDITALTRKVRKSALAKDAGKAADFLKQAVKKLDKAAAKKIMRKNTVSRTKSRLAKAVNKIVK